MCLRALARIEEVEDNGDNKVVSRNLNEEDGGQLAKEDKEVKEPEGRAGTRVVEQQAGGAGPRVSKEASAVQPNKQLRHEVQINSTYRQRCKERGTQTEDRQAMEAPVRR